MSKFILKKLKQFISNPRVLLFWIRIGLASVFMKVGCRFLSPILIAFGWRFWLNRSSLFCPTDQTRRIKSQKGAKATLIILDRVGGNEDIESAFRNQVAAYKIRFLNRYTMKQLFRCFVHDSVKDNNYISNNTSIEKSKERYRSFLKKVLKFYTRCFGSIAFVQFNLLYHAEVELAHACCDLGIQFINAQKECLRPCQAWMDIEPQLRETRGSFRGTEITVYNQATADTFINAGVADAERIHVVGCARMDEAHSFRCQFNGRVLQPTVVYFMIDPRVSSPNYRRSDGVWVRGFFDESGHERTWAHMIARVNRCVIQVAEAHPDINFVFKGKSGFSDQQIGALGASLPNNISLARDYAGHTLLERATVVVGFNTTAVFEAIASGVPTVVPHLFSETESPLLPYTFDFKGAALCPTTEQEFKQMIVDKAIECTRYTELTEAQKSVLDLHLGNADGLAGQRLKAYLDNAMAAV